MQYNDFLKELESGKTRAADFINGSWVVNFEVKKKILEIFSNSKVVEMPGGFRDKEPFILRSFQEKDMVRMVPGGTAVRPGTYVGRNVVIMPPSYINIGSYIDEGAMVDNHVLVGSCAQIGKRVHLSAAVQIGGVLEPIGNRPVIIEDDCFIGAGSIITEGVLVKRGAVIAPGVTLSASIAIYDTINEKVYKGEIPENALVIPGSKPITQNQWSVDNALHIGCAIIIKYRDAKTDSALLLEESLRK